MINGCKESSQEAFDRLKKCFVEAPILSKFDFSRPFILDVDWYVKGVSVILSQKDGRIEMVIVYAILFDVQKRFHSMEGECYEVVWGLNYTFDNIYIKHSFC
jgi:hypothetical protein